MGSFIGETIFHIGTIMFYTKKTIKEAKQTLSVKARVVTMPIILKNHIIFIKLKNLLNFDSSFILIFSAI